MPRLLNPTEFHIYAHHLDKNVPAGEWLPITDEQADAYHDSTVFRVLDDDGNPIGGAPDEAEAEEAPAESVKPKRGTAAAGTTTTPAAEKRG